ncbi:uncharacterized protein EV420DRAFT_1644663 [Desarmillaria tabescens]|uniref:Amidohydrolase-related domain-containing protein n=1 Tax=Armillaria tabescens TaxID=1929756 RepID=A0AA39K6E8_ARMTA|nr:uncharacterized protein EV420DRAFT_1644663 [Desarmillaria tabescens]KAK0455429.1 hypothetical protein EV420DRAFT_1644663 [Desarmillaria tabescens]
MQDKAYRAALLVTSSSAEPISDGGILVSGDKIAASGPWSTTIAPLLTPTTTVTDLGAVTLVPGFFDCHVHVSFDPMRMKMNSSRAELSDAQTKEREARELMERNALRLLDAGVTTARDLASHGMGVMEMKGRIDRGEIMGARLMCANAPITVFGGHCSAMGGEAEGVEGVTKMTQKRLDEGAEVIKVMSTGGFMTAGSHPSEARYSVEELKAIADTAHASGVRVTTHALGGEGIRRAVVAGFDSIEHCSWSTKTGTKFDNEVAQLIVDKGVYVCPTMNTACLAGENYFCPWDHRAAIVANLASLRALNAKIIMGTDNGIGNCPFERYADGLTALADAGYTPRELLAACTDMAAEACGLSEVTGKLLPGFVADVAAVEGNPVESIEAFTKPRFVLARGKEHKLTPIAPLPADHKEKIGELMAMLRKGAGFKD